MTALDRKLARDLWRIKGMAVAIMFVIAAGAATFVMSFGTMHALEETRGAFYERQRFADIFATVTRAPDRILARVQSIPGVRWSQARIVKDVTLDIAGLGEPASGRLISLPGPTGLNGVVIRRGRAPAPGHPGEVVINEAFAGAHDFEAGDFFHATLNGKKRRLDIVGVALSPEYVYSIAPGALMPDDRRFGVVWMNRPALAAAFDLDGAFNDVSIILARGANTTDVLKRLDSVLERYGGVGAIERKDQTSHWFLSSDIDQLRTMATVLPTIFLGVSAFLLNTVISRLIATEREQIGLLKAFGYTNAAVGWHYLKLVLAISVSGVIVGALFGAWLGREITEIYTQFYRFPVLYYRFNVADAGIAAGVSILAAMLGVWNAISRAASIAPAVAMTPASPTLYTKGLIQRIGESRAFDTLTAMIVRQTLRRPIRTMLTVIGVALSFAVLLMSLHWLDAVEHIVVRTCEHAQKYDVRVTFAEARSRRAAHALARLPGVQAVEPYRATPVRYRFGRRERREVLVGAVAEPRLDVVLDAHDTPVALAENGLTMSTKLAELLGAKLGDVVTIEVLEGRRPVLRAPITSMFETYLGTPSYMRLSTLNGLMREGPRISGAYILADSAYFDPLNRALKNTPMVAGAAFRSAIINSFRETLADTINFMVGFYILFAGTLAFGVTYNSARISLSERGRELASLRVLGFSTLEISYVLLGELALLTLVALPVGGAFGMGLSWIMTQLFETDLYRIPLYIEPSTIGVTTVVILGAYIFSAAAIWGRIGALDLIGVLKTRE
ncbi:MAG: FtsX-like permease family protein [Rhodospirillaceae bacterium]|nr:FtsX-like permease family protein [Rhodospirillaceae bacterium]